MAAIALWLAGSQGKRVGQIHTVRDETATHIFTRCGLERAKWGEAVTALRTLAVPVTAATRSTCAKCT